MTQKNEQKKLRKTLVFSQRNKDIFEELEDMQENKVNISEYICTLIRNDLAQNSVDFKLDTIQQQLNQLQQTLDTKSFVAAATQLLDDELPSVEIVEAKDDVIDDIDDMLGF